MTGTVSEDVAAEFGADFAPHTAQIETFGPIGRVLLLCEHASNHIPAEWGDLGLSQAERLAHIAWDPGALALARALAARLQAGLIHAGVSRLVYDLNRPPHHPGAMPEQSEIYHIPGNQNLSPKARLARVAGVYLPFHAAAHSQIARRMALGLRPVLITIHSFTPVYHGAPRAVEFGVIHDADARLATAIVKHAPANLNTQLNEPYAAKDGVTHMLKMQAGPYGLANAMLEIRNDLIADAAGVAAMADLLAPCLQAALAELEVE